MVLRGDLEVVARVYRQSRRGLLGWLYGEGVLVVPEDLVWEAERQSQRARAGWLGRRWPG